MKILYDHQAFEIQKIGGISRYFSEMLHLNSNAIRCNISIKRTENEYLKKANYISKALLVKSRIIYKIIKSLNFIKGAWRINENFIIPVLIKKVNKKYSLRILKKGDFDIFHPTYYNPYFLHELNEKPFVITVYDLIHEIFPKQFIDNTIENKKLVINKAQKIIAISNSTKNDLIDLYQIPEEKIEVVHLASSVDVSKSTPIKGLPSRFILYVGERGGYKNFEKFICAAEVLLKEDANLQIVCTGKPFLRNEKKFLKNYSIYHRVKNYFATEEEMVYLYQKALLFVFPSCYEGFGIPLLEAMTCGCPVVASNTSSFPEVGGDAALYFNPYQTEEITSQMRKVMYDNVLRNKLIKNGFEQVKNFSWDICREQTLSVYERMC